MKKHLVLFIVLCCFFSYGLVAQKDIKLGYVNSDSLLPYVPGKDSLQKIMEELVSSYEEQLNAMNVKYEALYDAFRQDSLAMAADSGKAAIYEMLMLKKKMNDFKKNAETVLQNKQNDMLQTLIIRMEKAIADVARENGFTFIIDSSTSNGLLLLYAAKEGDLTPLVKKKLGIK